MARPRKTALDYFPLDVDFFSDEKMVCIHGEFGIKGQVVALHLLCAIYRQGYFARWDERLRLKIASATGLSADLVQMVVQRLVKWSFFDEGVFDSDGVLTSPGIQRRYFEATRRRGFNPDCKYLLINAAKTPPERDVGVSAAKTPVSAAKTPVSAAKTPIKKSKYKRIPSNEEIPKASPPPLSFDDEFSAFISDSQWCESLCMHFRLSREDLTLKFRQFATHCTLEAKSHSSLRDAKAHFSRWLNRNLYSSKPTENATNRQPPVPDDAKRDFDIADFVARNLGR